MVGQVGECNGVCRFARDVAAGTRSTVRGCCADGLPCRGLGHGGGCRGSSLHSPLVPISCWRMLPDGSLGIVQTPTSLCKSAPAGVAQNLCTGPAGPLPVSVRPIRARVPPRLEAPGDFSLRFPKVTVAGRLHRPGASDSARIGQGAPALGKGAGEAACRVFCATAGRVATAPHYHAKHASCSAISWLRGWA